MNLLYMYMGIQAVTNARPLRPISRVVSSDRLVSRLVTRANLTCAFAGSFNGMPFVRRTLSANEDAKVAC